MNILNLAQAVLGIDPSLPQLLVASGICATMAAQLPSLDAGLICDEFQQFADLLARTRLQALNALAKIVRPDATVPPPTTALALVAVLGAVQAASPV